MKDKNGKEILKGKQCLVDNKLGLVTGFHGENVTVLMLNDGGQTCSEQLMKPDKILLK